MMGEIRDEESVEARFCRKILAIFVCRVHTRLVKFIAYISFRHGRCARGAH
jgi:hypothetical protein